MKYKIIIVVVSVLIGGIGGFVINSLCYKSEILYENQEEGKENEQFEKDEEDDKKLIRQGSIARIDYPLIDIYFDKNKKYKIVIKEFGDNQKTYKEYVDTGDFFQYNKEKFSIETIPSGRGTTPEYILSVYEEDDCIKMIDCSTIRTDFFDSSSVGQTNDEKISSNNIVSGGELAEASGKIYYSNANDNWSLYCKNIKGGNKEYKLNNDICDNINTGDDWLFCRDVRNHRIIKMRLDGSEKQVIYKGIIDNLIYSKGFLYFIEEDDGKQYIIKIKSDGSDPQKVCSDSIYNMILYQDWFYYYSMKDKMIKKVKEDGSSNSCVIKAEVEVFVMGENGIFFADKEQQKICYVDYNGNNLSAINDICPNYMNIWDGWIYYCNVNNHICRREIKGHRDEKYVEDNVLRFYMTNNVLLYDYIEKNGTEEKISQKLIAR